MHCATIFHKRVSGVRMVNFGNLKLSMNSRRPWYRQTGSSTFERRNSSSPSSNLYGYIMMRNNPWVYTVLYRYRWHLDSLWYVTIRIYNIGVCFRPLHQPFVSVLEVFHFQTKLS